MVKIKVVKGEHSTKRIGNSFFPVYTYIYTVQVFGFIIHAIVLHELEPKEARQIFGKHCPE